MTPHPCAPERVSGQWKKVSQLGSLARNSNSLHIQTLLRKPQRFFFFSPRFWSYFSFKLRRGGVDGWIKAIDALSSASTRSGISKLKQPGRYTDTVFFDIQYSASSELGATFAAPHPGQTPSGASGWVKDQWTSLDERLCTSPHSCSSSPGCSISTDQSVLLDCQHAASASCLHQMSIFDSI